MGSEVAILWYCLSVYLSKPVFSLICCPDYNFYCIRGYFYKNRVHLLRLFEYFFSIFPTWMQNQPVNEISFYYIINM